MSAVGCAHLTSCPVTSSTATCIYLSMARIRTASTSPPLTSVYATKSVVSCGTLLLLPSCQLNQRKTRMVLDARARTDTESERIVTTFGTRPIGSVSAEAWLRTSPTPMTRTFRKGRSGGSEWPSMTSGPCGWMRRQTSKFFTRSRSLARPMDRWSCSWNKKTCNKPNTRSPISPSLCRTSTSRRPSLRVAVCRACTARPHQERPAKRVPHHHQLGQWNANRATSVHDSVGAAGELER